MKDPQLDPELPEPVRNKKTLGPTESFTFSCHIGLPCFRQCCRDVNIFLTPLDVLALSRRLGMDTERFLKEHVMFPITRDLHLPVAMLKMNHDKENHCPFIGKDGCTVYEDRPWACRMYPLGSALPPSRADKAAQPIYFLMEDSFCLGKKEPTDWTVSTYRENQVVPEREVKESGFQEIVSHPWFIGGRQLDPRRIEMFHMAAYNLDVFRRFVFSSTFLQRFELDKVFVETLRTDDEALLQFAFEWLKFALFGEPTMRVRTRQ